ncbi:MAG TPA: ATP-binding protein, partial [Patescibacteria group bacterium]|nr:ATP-binding protein [Patescibacteria group bacterium]
LYPIHLNSKIYQMRIRVSDKNGWAVVAFADQEMIAARNQTILYKIAILYGMGILLSLLTAIVATRRITRPIAKLARGALAITTGDLKAKVDINDQDEFGFLAASFNQMASELRESFAKIKRQTEEMRKQENEFQTLVENAQDIISRLDKSMRYLYVNPVIESYIDVAAPDFIHKTNQEIGFPEEFYQPLEACYHKVFHTGNDRLLELEFPGFDGNSVYFQAHIIPEFDPHGRVETLLSVMRNITERKELEKNLARLDRLNLVGEMAAGIAHEVRNPMTTVRGYLQMMSRKAELAAYGDQFQLMIDELDRANDIISEFLALAKNKRVDLQMTNLNSIVKNLQPLIQADASIVDKMTVWELNEIPSVYADEKEVRQLILNLVRNGLEAMDAGGRLTISTWAEKGGVVLTIKDQGKGIKAEVLEKIGMPFMTTKDNGTGLGLAMCYSIAARHHAKIDIQTGNDGTSVAVRFPRGHWRHGK